MPFIPYSGSSKAAELGSSVGAGFGQGISDQINEGLQMLAQQRLQDIQRKQEVYGLEPIYGKAGAERLVYTKPEDRKIFLQNPDIVRQYQNYGMPKATGINALPAAQNQMPQQRPNELATMEDLIQAIQQIGGVDRDRAMKLIEQNPNLADIYNEDQAIAQQGNQPTQQMQMPEQPSVAQNNLLSPETVANAYIPEAVKIQREKLKLQKLSAVQPQLTKIEDAARPQRIIQRDAKKALEYVEKAITGPAGKLTPAYFQSAEGQRLSQLLDSIVIQKAQTGKGLPTRQRLELEKGAKAQLFQKPKVISEILQDILSDPELKRDIARDMAREEILQSSGDNIPDNLVSQIDQRAKEMIKSEEQSLSKSLSKSSLPDASKLPDGAKARNPFSGEVQYVVKNGKWEEA